MAHKVSRRGSRQSGIPVALPPADDAGAAFLYLTEEIRALRGDISDLREDIKPLASDNSSTKTTLEHLKKKCPIMAPSAHASCVGHGGSDGNGLGGSDRPTAPPPPVGPNTDPSWWTALPMPLRVVIIVAASSVAVAGALLKLCGVI